MVLGDPLSPARSFDLYSRKTCALMCVLCVEKMIDAIGRLRTRMKRRLFSEAVKAVRGSRVCGCEIFPLEGGGRRLRRGTHQGYLEPLLRRRPVRSLEVATGASLVRVKWGLGVKGRVWVNLRWPSWELSLFNPCSEAPVRSVSDCTGRLRTERDEEGDGTHEGLRSNPS